MREGRGVGGRETEVERRILINMITPHPSPNVKLSGL